MRSPGLITPPSVETLTIVFPEKTTDGEVLVLENVSPATFAIPTIDVAFVLSARTNTAEVVVALISLGGLGGRTAKLGVVVALIATISPASTSPAERSAKCSAIPDSARAALSDEIVREPNESQKDATQILSEIIAFAEIIFALMSPAKVSTGVLVAEIERYVFSVELEEPSEELETSPIEKAPFLDSTNQSFVVVPTPTFPPLIESITEAVSVSVKRGEGDEIDNADFGADVPIPTRPSPVTTNEALPNESSATKVGPSLEIEFCTANLADLTS